MPRIDDYKNSFRLAAQDLKSVSLEERARICGAEMLQSGSGALVLRVPFMNSPYTIEVGDEVEVRREGDEGDVPLPEKILICHYVLHSTGKLWSEKFITFREVPDGHFYYDAFQRRARDPFLSTFGSRPELFLTCAQQIGGRPAQHGDAAMSFQIFPNISIDLVLWRGDDEFPAEAGILFREGTESQLSAEDIAVMSGMLVYRLMAISRAHG